MIPGIAEILEMFKAGECTMTQALGWIEQHMAGADLRDQFAAQVLPAYFSNGEDHGSFSEAAKWAYDMADAMTQARSA